MLQGVPAAKAVYDNGWAWHVLLVLTQDGQVLAWGDNTAAKLTDAAADLDRITRIPELDIR